MCTMKEVCKEIGMNYETLKFYCKEGLVPNVKRDKNNYRNFDEKNIAWLKGIQCLRKCGLGVSEIKIYMNLIFVPPIFHQAKNIYIYLCATHPTMPSQFLMMIFLGFRYSYSCTRMIFHKNLRYCLCKTDFQGRLLLCHNH